MSSQAALFCLLLPCPGASGPCKRSSLSASARSPFSRRKCSSRDSGDRHIPAQRWCCRAIARYSIVLVMTVLPRKCCFGTAPLARQIEHGRFNRFLASLPPHDFSLLAPHLRTVALERGVMLHEV